MNYTPKTAAQLAKEGLLPEGIYDFEIIDTDDRPSKKGNEMITLKLFVFGGDDGGTHHVYDYLVFGSNFGERKFRKAAEACGLMEIYDSGRLGHLDFMGATGKALIKQQDGTAEYPTPKNIIGEYVPREGTSAPKPTKPVFDDDIPWK